MKIKAILLTLALGATLLVGCGANNEPAKTEETTITEETTAAVADVVTTASIVDTEAAFESAISAEGTWIIATLKDLTFDKELVVDGDFKNGKTDEKDETIELMQRKIGLYTQDEDRNVTNRFTLTAPKLTFKSVMGSIEHGIFIGDLYVSANDFKLKDAKVDGNVYFTTEEAQSTFTMDETSEVTGVKELKK
ncbi:hypothetical protein [Clostridium sp.]|uniref:hypothetical protein n=1 Tax=Clostridium sp. TaxID=1506 RepID=UPI001A396A5B|nr:hypothetical protein [Clostridium sp.]MBK5240983.1 hypothetical protein [Clostridium sp.]